MGFAASVALKNQLDRFGGNARAHVADPYLYVPLFLRDIDADFAAGRILHRIVEQVGQRNAQQPAINKQRRRGGIGRHEMAPEPDLEAVLQRKVHHRRRHLNHRQQRRVPSIDGKRFGGEPGIGQAVIGELHEAGGCPLHAIQSGRLLQGCGAQAQVFQRGLDNRQRRSELVRHHPHKLALMKAGFTLDAQLPRQLLFLQQPAVFRANPPHGDDQHGDDMDDQRVLPGGVDRLMIGNDAVYRQQHQHR